MEIRAVAGDVVTFVGDGLVVNLFERAGISAKGVGHDRMRRRPPLSGATAALDAALGGAITKLVQAEEATGKWGEQTLIHSLRRLPVERILVMGLGKPEDLTPDRIRMVAAESARTRAASDAGSGGNACPTAGDVG